MPDVLWTPTPQFKEQSNLSAFLSWLKSHKNLSFDNYDDLWEWSVTDTQAFWQSIWEYFQIKSYSTPTQVHTPGPMPDVQWFPGATLNYAEHVFRQATADRPAIIFREEGGREGRVEWTELEDQVFSFASYLRSAGVRSGDCVAGYLPNIPEATVCFLAAASMGAIWSCCSPDFGSASVIDRFGQIRPKVLIAVAGYNYGGVYRDRMDQLMKIEASIPSIEQVVIVHPPDEVISIPGIRFWTDCVKAQGEKSFEIVPFSHPLWVLYSSGTTGQPKAIVHSHGGCLLEHLKYLTFHNDVKPGEKFFWYTTTGWMMWNFVQAALLVGATIVLYDGHPMYPSSDSLWKLVDEEEIEHFGTSAPFIVASIKKGVDPTSMKLTNLRSISSTGSPLSPEGFTWIYDKVKKDLWLCSMSGGTDVCSAFVGGCPTEPVMAGEIQRRALGCSLWAVDEDGRKVKDEMGEMVITEPMPSMPIYFWGDEGGQRYKESYFEMFPGWWRHGDWVVVTSRDTIVILGRSDATLNRQGVRIGTAEIYQSMNKVSEVEDCLIVNLDLPGLEGYMPLFVVLKEDQMLTKELKEKIKQQLRSDYSPRHIPDEIVTAPQIPYTISGKKLELPVKKILSGIPIEKAANKGAMRNPESLDFFLDFYRSMKK